MTRRLPPLVALVLVALACGACAGSPADAATVGDGAISIDQLERDMVLFEFLSGLSGAPCGREVMVSTLLAGTGLGSAGETS